MFQLLSATMVALAVLIGSTVRAQPGADELTPAFAAAKPATAYVLALPNQGRGHGSAAECWIKLNLVPAFCGKIHASEPGGRFASARTFSLPRSAGAAPPPLVGTVELRI